MSWRFVCRACGAREPRGYLGSSCRACGGLQEIDWTTPRRLAIAGEVSSIWRYASILPVERPAGTMTLGEGWSPVVQARLGGRRVLLKLDSVLPSGSFKDRGTVVLVQYALESGAREIVIDSSGNAGGSVAMYAARAGLRCRVFVPAGNSCGKVTQAAAHGAQVVPVEGPRNAASDAAEEAGGDGVFHANHNRSPLFVAGVATWLLEVAEATTADTRLAFMPAGGGSVVAGALEAMALSRRFELHAVQPAACGPLAAAFAGAPAEVSCGDSLAEGTNIAAPARLEQVVDGVRATGGSIRAVSEEAIADACRQLWAQGIYVEPTAALVAAGFLETLAEGADIGDDEAVLLISGHGLKTTPTNAQLIAA